MRVLMLGWEFPPFITGGLGTACYGLTKALDRRGMYVTFVLPKEVDETHAGHVNLVSPAIFSKGTWGGTSVGPSGPDAAAHTLAALAAPTPPRLGAAETDPRARLASAAPSARDVLQSVALAHGAHAADASPGGSPGASPAAGKPEEFDSPRIVTTIRERLSILGLGETSAYAVNALSPEERAVVASYSQALIRSGGLLAPERVHAATSEAGAIAVIERVIREVIPEAAGRAADHQGFLPNVGTDYGGDLIGEADRYARFVVAACGRLRFDVIHAHDWLTYPAGLALARVTGRPLVVHVHSTEFDRSGVHVNQRVYDIERRGMHGAIKVVSVSMLTKNLCVNRYSVPADKIEVIYNGVDLAPQAVGMEDIQTKDKIVLYFGRITMQKGPEFFIQAAKRVLDVYKDVKFVVAGSGDQATRMIELAASLGIGQKVLFTGFLRGKDIARVFSLADLYVMPSVSEPFGIAPLEAMGHDVPVLISRTSGVSEVLTHALKCDFWDVDDMANKIVAVLRYPPLQRTLREHGRFEVRRLSWDGAADRCEQVYHAAIAALGRRVGEVRV